MRDENSEHCKILAVKVKSPDLSNHLISKNLKSIFTDPHQNDHVSAVSDDVVGGILETIQMNVICSNKVQPVVDLALQDAYRKYHLEPEQLALTVRNFRYVPMDSMAVTYRDSRLSDAHGPNVAIQQLVLNQLDCIIGYAFVYALAPVARMCPYWQDKDSNGIPVITPIGLTMNLDNKQEYQTLTRISGPYKFGGKNRTSLFTGGGPVYGHPFQGDVLDTACLFIPSC
uniref:DUF3506 domain-containing protein n=1 Tax=Heterorhabditis bacteriophora TaxID=37862 RepID=A0A1I7WNK6_HETBA